MISRRNLLAGVAGIAATSLATSPSWAHHTGRRTARNHRVPRKFRPKNVRYRSNRAVGSIVVDTRNHYLYLITGRGKARRYGVGVGKAGLQFAGSAKIGRKAKWPSWTPTANMIRREPRRYRRWAGGMPGGPNNPLGARALYLYRNGRDTYFRIHGTTEPWSIGTNVSSGCIRMVNDHVVDLYGRVKIGARVYTV